MEQVIWSKSWNTVLVLEKGNVRGKGENEREDRWVCRDTLRMAEVGSCLGPQQLHIGNLWNGLGIEISLWSSPFPWPEPLLHVLYTVTRVTFLKSKSNSLTLNMIELSNYPVVGTSYASAQKHSIQFFSIIFYRPQDEFLNSLLWFIRLLMIWPLFTSLVSPLLTLHSSHPILNYLDSSKRTQLRLVGFSPSTSPTPILPWGRHVDDTAPPGSLFWFPWLY